MPRMYSPDRSRAMIWMPGWAFSHSAKVSAVRPGSRSVTRRRSRSTRMVPYSRLRRYAQSSTPTTLGLPMSGLGTRRITRNNVSALVGSPSLLANR